MDEKKNHHAMKMDFEIFSARKVSLNMSLIHLNDNLLEGIYHPMENRTKRALLDIGGKLLQGIFGVATEIDLDLLRVRFDNSTRKLISSQNKIVIMTNVLKDSILNLSNAMFVQNKLLHKFKKNNDIKLRMMQTMSLIGESVSLIHVLLSEYQNLIETLRQNSLPTNVVTKQNLEKIIKEGINKFPGTKFPGNSKGNLSKMINAVTVHQTENPLKFILYVPFVSENDFDIYKIVAVPIIGKYNKMFIASEISGYIGISKLFYFFSKHKLNCHKFYCESDLHLVKTSTKSCALDVITNGTGNECLVEKFETTQNYYIEQLQSFWVVVFFETTSFVISCGTEKTFRESKGLFKVPLVCTLETENFILTSVSISNSKVELRKKVFKYEMLDVNKTIINSNISDHGLKSLDIIEKRLSNIKLETEKSMNELESKNMQFRKNTYFHIGANYSSLLLIILPVGVVIFWKTRQYRKNNKFLENKFSEFDLRKLENKKNVTM